MSSTGQCEWVCAAGSASTTPSKGCRHFAHAVWTCGTGPCNKMLSLILFRPHMEQYVRPLLKPYPHRHPQTHHTSSSPMTIPTQIEEDETKAPATLVTHEELPKRAAQVRPNPHVPLMQRPVCLRPRPKCSLFTVGSHWPPQRHPGYQH